MVYKSIKLILVLVIGVDFPSLISLGVQPEAKQIVVVCFLLFAIKDTTVTNKTRLEKNTKDVGNRIRGWEKSIPVFYRYGFESE